MQLTYSMDPNIAREGMIADSRLLKHITGKLAVGGIKAGLGCFRVPGYGQSGTRRLDPGQIYQNPGQATAVDVDAILAGGASSASIQTLTAASFNGVIGSAVMYPGRKITLVLSSHANWDLTNATLTGKNQYGVTVSETLAIPDAGNATVTSTNYYTQVTSLVIPAQSGVSGTFTVGVTVLDSAVTLADFVGVAVLDLSIPGVVIPSQDATYEYQDKNTVSVMRKGAIWVYSENAVSEGDPVYVRTASGSGGTQLGAFRGTDDDTSTAVALTGAIWGRDSGVAALNILELY